MATQNCPRCKSGRIRHGYRPTSIFKKLVFRYNLLCDDCNWEFIGVAIPGTVSTKVKKRKALDLKKNQAKTAADKGKNNSAVNIEAVSGVVLYEISSLEPEISTAGSIQTNENSFIIGQEKSQNKNKIRKKARVKLS
jgi:hypothetical protein